MTDRLVQLKTWLDGIPGMDSSSMKPASADASFRRYFRVFKGKEAFIVMDAPPDKEDSEPFITIARKLHAIGLNTPVIHQEDLAQGFLLLSDLGNEVYLSSLNTGTADRLYGDAMTALTAMQNCTPCNQDIPEYNEDLLMTEMALFPDWLLSCHCQMTLTGKEKTLLHDVFEVLAANALEQPQVFVHRDYHSRNLMISPKHNPGILDFQDAVVGPLTYDLVSLLRDCYIAWPQERVTEWALDYKAQAEQLGIIPTAEISDEKFLRWFDLMGIQRHLKAAGIFARLKHRDRKNGYMKDVPRTLNYIIDVSRRYPELEALGEFVSQIKIGPSAT